MPTPKATLYALAGRPGGRSGETLHLSYIAVTVEGEATPRVYSDGEPLLSTIRRLEQEGIDAGHLRRVAFGLPEGPGGA